MAFSLAGPLSAETMTFLMQPFPPMIRDDNGVARGPMPEMMHKLCAAMKVDPYAPLEFDLDARIDEQTKQCLEPFVREVERLAFDAGGDGSGGGDHDAHRLQSSSARCASSAHSTCV